MSNHKVLALKYRPKNFDELVGQESVSHTLSSALNSGKLSHAYLFSGLRGSGKTSTARIFAKALLCEKGISSKPCEECASCVQARENRHIDIIELDAASNRRIDDVRDLIEQTKYAPTSSRFKIFIIDEVHMLTTEAFNALLKTLEEPPSYVKFLLATTDPLKLPPTILSRVQHFRFKKIAFDAVLDHLKMILQNESVAFDDKALEVIARAGSGSLRDTLTLLEQAIIYGNGKVELEITTSMLGVLDPAKIERFFELVFASDQKQIMEFMREIESFDSETVLEGLITHLKEQLFETKAPFSTLVIERFFRILSDAKTMLLQGFDNSFVLILMSLKLVESLKASAIDDEIKELEEELKKAPRETQSVPVRTATVAPAQPKELLPFDKLKQKIYDRNRALGEAFDRSVEFVGFEDDKLSWISCADDDDKAKLSKDYPIIRTLVQEIFGIQTKIVPIPCNRQVEEKKPDQQEKEPPKSDQTPVTKKDGVLEIPFVQKAIEVFEPSKISIITQE